MSDELYWREHTATIGWPELHLLWRRGPGEFYALGVALLGRFSPWQTWHATEVELTARRDAARGLLLRSLAATKFLLGEIAAGRGDGEMAGDEFQSLMQYDLRGQVPLGWRHLPDDVPEEKLIAQTGWKRQP